MPEPDRLTPPSDSGPSLAQMEDATRALARALADYTLYGREHSVTHKSMETAYAEITSLSAVCPALRLGASEQDLMVNGVSTGTKHPLLQSLASRLRSLSVGGLEILTDITPDEFVSLMDLLNHPLDDLAAAGGFAAVVEAVGLKHVLVRKVSYQVVEEGQSVVQDADLQPGAEAVKAGALAFLSSVPGSDAEPLRVAAADPAALADIILQASRSGDEPVDPEKVARRILDNVRRSFEALCDGKDGNSRSGRKRIEKTMVRLQREIVDQAPADVPESLSAELSGAVDEMVDDLNVGTLALEYARARVDDTKRRNRLVAFIRRAGPEGLEKSGLKDQLLDAGLSESDWRRLEADAAIGTAGSGTQGGLAGLLSQARLAGGAAGGPGDGGADLLPLLQQVEQEVDALVEATRKRIQELTDDLAKRAAPGKPPVQEDSLIPVFAEIVQEFCQPLSVVSCALDILKQRAGAGGVDADVLELAARSMDRLDVLIAKMTQISGLPSSLHPSEDIRRKLYEDG